MHRHRVNQQIWSKEVRVVGPEGEDFGIMAIEEALEKAKELKLDLVEVAAQAKPPVTKIMNYGKYRFELEKREKEARKKQKAIQLKEVKLRPKIGEHDREFKVSHGIDFLKEGHKLKVTIMFSGREMAHTEIGRALLDDVSKQIVPEFGKVESQPRLEGRNLSMTITPRQGVGKKLEDEEDEIEAENGAEAEADTEVAAEAENGAEAEADTEAAAEAEGQSQEAPEAAKADEGAEARPE